MNALLLLLLIQDEPVRVVTTLEVLAALTREVGGDRVTVEALATPERDPHYVEPAPDFMVKVRSAALFVEVGMQLDVWGRKVIEGAGNPDVRIVTASADCRKGEVPTELSRAGGDIHPDGNPHVWLDPINAAAMARTIAEALAARDAAHADGYRARADDFERRIYAALIGEECLKAMKPDHVQRLGRRGRLVEFVRGNETLAPLLGGWAKQAEPLAGVAVVSYHKTYFYAAERFGFSIVAELEEKPGQPPQAAHKAEVVRIAKEQGVRLILNDAFYPRDAADYVAGETGAKVVVTKIDGDDYFKLIDELIAGLQ